MATVIKDSNEERVKTAQNAKITLYWLDRSRAQRILWLLEELHLTYDLKIYKRQRMLAPPELKEIHPLGKAPLLSIGDASNPDKKPLILAESAFIVEYLLDHFGPEGMVPERYAIDDNGKKDDDGGRSRAGEETESWVRYRYFMHYAEGSMMGLLVIWLLLSNIKTGAPFFLRPLVLMITNAVSAGYLNPNLKMTFDFLESQLATSPNDGEYLCGNKLTGADIMMSAPLVASKSRSLFTEKEHPKLCAYVDRLVAGEGYKRAVQKIVEVVGKYEDL